MNVTLGGHPLEPTLAADKQEDALRMCFEEDWQTKQPVLITVAELRRELKRRQGADLSTAPFALDARIGGVGPCTECPKCSGVQRSLIADDTADQVCFDRTCYDGKVKAHVDFKDIEGQVRAELAEAAQKKAGKGAGK